METYLKVLLWILGFIIVWSAVTAIVITLYNNWAWPLRFSLKAQAKSKDGSFAEGAPQIEIFINSDHVMGSTQSARDEIATQYETNVARILSCKDVNDKDTCLDPNDPKYINKKKQIEDLHEDMQEKLADLPGTLSIKAGETKDFSIGPQFSSSVTQKAFQRKDIQSITIYIVKNHPAHIQFRPKNFPSNRTTTLTTDLAGYHRLRLGINIADVDKGNWHSGGYFHISFPNGI